MEERPEYTEFGIKIHKLRLTLKVHKRQQGQQDDPPRPASSSDLYSEPIRRNTRRRARSTRTNSTASSLADSLRQLDLDPMAGSRRPCQEKGSTKVANWEFQGFYSAVPPPVSSPGIQTMVSTPSSGYSSAAVSRTSSFSLDPQSKQFNQCPRSTRLSSADDSVYSEVYSTIDELSELPDPFDDPTEGPPKSSPFESSPICCSLPSNISPSTSKSATLKISHSKTASNVTTVTTSTLSANSSNIIMLGTNPNTSTHSKHSSQSKNASAEKLYHPSHSEFDFPPPLPPRISSCRPPARPPYPSSIVRAVQEITKPLER